MSNGHMDVEVETILRGEGNQTSNLVVTMIATKRQMKPGSRQNHEYHDKNLVADSKPVDRGTSLGCVAWLRPGARWLGLREPCLFYFYSLGWSMT